MSWSGTCTVPKGGSVQEAVQSIQVTGDEEHWAERTRAAQTAKNYAAWLIESGVMGNPAACAWNVSISGCCNPGNRARHGEAADGLAICVQQAEG